MTPITARPPEPRAAMAGFILAGGRSRRMGTDKTRLLWGSETLVEHMRRRLRTVTSSVRVVGPGDLEDAFPGEGPVEGIRTALRATESDLNVVVAVDLPFLSAPFLEFLLGRLRDGTAPMVACAVAGRMPLCLACHRDLLPVVESYREAGGRAVTGLVEAARAHIVDDNEFRTRGFDPAMFVNLNTPDDYARYRPSGDQTPRDPSR